MAIIVNYIVVNISGLIDEDVSKLQMDGENFVVFFFYWNISSSHVHNLYSQSIIEIAVSCPCLITVSYNTGVNEKIEYY